MAGGSTLDVQCSKGAAVLSLSGVLTETGHRQFGEILDWLIAAGTRRVTVRLAVGQIDAALLQVLHHARGRLPGGLQATATDPQIRWTLGLVGLDGLSAARAT